MAALTTNANRVNLGPVDGTMGLTPTVSTEYFAGSIVGINKQTGRAVKWVDASNAGVVFQGIMPQYINVDASGNDTTRATQVTGVVPAILPVYPMFQRMAQNLPVAGVTAVTDHLAPVFCLTDNAKEDLTLTAPADDRAPVGIVWKFRSTGYADVLFFAPMEAVLFTLIGVYDEWIHGTAVAGFSTGVTYAKVSQGRSGEITNVLLYTATPTVTTGGSATLQVNVNGGDDLFASADVVLKAAVDGKGEVFVSDEAVVTTGNRHIFHDGDTVNVIVADGGTPFAAGTFMIALRFKRLIGV